MKDEYLISVVVPVYNGEKYINRCINSIGKHADVQCVFVDDGSNDTSGAILDTICESYDNYNVIHVKNSGVSNARNIGVQHSKGRWVTFLDVDDTFVDNWYEIVSLNIDDENDFMCFSHLWEYVEGKTKIVGYSSQQRDRLLLETPEMNPCWSKIYKRDIILKNGIKFDTKMKYGEDFCFVFDYCVVSEKCAFYSEPLVYYRNNLLGVMHSGNIEKRLTDNEIMLHKRLEYALNKNPELVKGVYTHHFCALTDMLRSVALYGERKCDDFKIIKGHSYLMEVINNIQYGSLGILKKLELFLVRNLYCVVPAYFKLKAGVYKMIG